MSLPPHLRRGGFSETVARRGLGTTGRDQTPTAVRKAEAGSLAHCFICHKQRPSRAPKRFPVGKRMPALVRQGLVRKVRASLRAEGQPSCLFEARGLVVLCPIHRGLNRRSVDTMRSRLVSATQVDLNRRAKIVLEAWSKSLSKKDRQALETMETPEERVRRRMRRAVRIAKRRAAHV
jgi:hypothetical protein